MLKPERRRPGRPMVSSAHSIQTHAMVLFLENGFDETTVTEVAAAAGVGRTTLFRYFPSKADIVWAGFDDHLHRLTDLLLAQPHDISVMEAVRTAAVQALLEALDEQDVWRQRFQVLEQTETLRPEVALRWSHWARTVATFVARRAAGHPDDPIPAAVGGAIQAAFTGTLRTWLRTDDFGGDIAERMNQALLPVCQGLTVLTEPLHPSHPVGHPDSSSQAHS